MFTAVCCIDFDSCSYLNQYFWNFIFNLKLKTFTHTTISIVGCTITFCMLHTLLVIGRDRDFG